MSISRGRRQSLAGAPKPLHGRAMKQILVIGLAGLLCGCAMQGEQAVQRPHPDCAPAGWDRAKLDALKAAEFEIADADEREAFATRITACLADPDPALRDGIAFEALSHMLRAKQLDDATKRELLVDLSARLDAPDPMGFGRPFAATL